MPFVFFRKQCTIVSEHARSSYRGVLTAFLVTLFAKAPAAGNLISRNAQYRQHLAIQDLVHLAPERQTRLRWLLEVPGLVANERVRLPPDRRRLFKW